jgi:uncharacterized membrane protein
MDNLAEKLAGWFGSIAFIVLHIVWFSAWIVLHYIAGFDEEWAALTFIVSLEAIFLSLFILRAENVEAARQEKRLKSDLKTTKEILEKIEQTRPRKNAR